MRRAARPTAGLALMLLCLVVYLPGIASIPPVDRDESRFAQASRQMFESIALPARQRVEALHGGGLAVPMVQDRPRLNKPPLIYWLEVVSAALFTGGDPHRDAIWMYRVPNTLLALGTVLATWRLGRRVMHPLAAWIGAATLAVCPLLVFDVHQARADQALLFATTLALWALWECWSRVRRGERIPVIITLWLWGAIGIGILAKGPITPMIALLTAVALAWHARSAAIFRAVRPVWGIVIVLALAAPWVWSVGNHVGWSKYLSIVFDETLGRSVEPKEGHFGPPGYHVVLMAVLFWPGCLATIAGVVYAFERAFPAVQAPPRRGERSRVGYALAIARARVQARAAGAPGVDVFLLAWLVPSWVVFEAIGTKLPHYTMPMYPALALISARGLLRAMGPARAAGRRLYSAPLWLIIGTVLMLAPGVLAFVGGREKPFAVVASLVPCLALVAMAFWLVQRSSTPARGVVVGALTLALTHLTLFGTVLPRARALWVSSQLVETPIIRELLPEITGDVFSQGPSPGPGAGGAPIRIAAVGFHEDSLVFLTRARLTKLDEPNVREFLAGNPGAVLIAPTAMIESMGYSGDGVNRVTGINYSTGKRVDLSVIRTPTTGTAVESRSP